MMTEEQRAVIVAAGITPSASSTTQLRDAILALIAAGAATDYKASVRVATTANIASLAGGAPSTLDGITLVVNDRILVKDQSTASQNGIYYVATLGTGANGTWTRATDADAAGELTSGSIVPVEEGATNADSLWTLTTDGIITIGTTALTFARQLLTPTNPQIQPVTASVASNALTVGLNPTSLDFRSATLTNGVPNTRTIASALSLTIPAGATLGTVSGVLSRIILLALDNAGTVELAVVNLAGGNDLSETGLISTTTLTSGAVSVNQVFSATARTNVPYRVVGQIISTQATAGTWATAPSTVQGVGGQALASMASLGYGQTWQSVTRTSGTTYYNTTGRTIITSPVFNAPSNSNVAISVNGIQVAYLSEGGVAGNNAQFSAVVPPGQSYVFTVSSASLTSCAELR